MKKRPGHLALVASVLFFVAAAGDSQSAAPAAFTPTIAQVPSPLSMVAWPAIAFPLADSVRWFSLGGSMDLGIAYRIPGTIFTVSGGLQYAYVPVRAAASLSVVAAGAGVGLQVPIAGTVSAYGYGMGGGHLESYNDFSKRAFGPYVAGGLGLRLAVSQGFAITLGAQYTYFLGLYQGLGAGAGVDVSLGNLGGSVEMPSVDLLPAFPVFYKYYDDHPIGQLQMKSTLKVPATDMQIQVSIKELMDSPKIVDVAGSLAPGQSRSVDLYALFNDKVLSITEGTKVATEITVSYKVEGRTYQNRRIETLTIWGRNAMTWDDDRKAAAYVTAKDPGVLNFARSVASYIHSKETRSLCDNLQAAIAFNEAIDLFGINYSPNPVTPYARVSKERYTVDFLQFPRETFRYKAGDCSDLSILYAALFQAVGINAAFITVPGHIFVAFDTGLTPLQAPKELIPEGQFIAYKDKAWVPLEVTSIHDGFCKAWELGVKEWTENRQTGAAAFYPVNEAWIVYQPVGLPGEEATLAVPQSRDVLLAYQEEAQKYLDSALAPVVADLQEKARGGSNVAAMNSLGVLYAKYGRPQDAERQFTAILAKNQYMPAALNLGNLYSLQGDLTSALDRYKQADEMAPGNAHVLLALARVNQELRNYTEAKSCFDRLNAVDPILARQYAFLGEGQEGSARAADVASERSLWETTE
jgi:tetratricopeptide (TPR) repeat protein